MNKFNFYITLIFCSCNSYLTASEHWTCQLLNIAGLQHALPSNQLFEIYLIFCLIRPNAYLKLHSWKIELPTNSFPVRFIIIIVIACPSPLMSDVRLMHIIITKIRWTCQKLLLLFSLESTPTYLGCSACSYVKQEASKKWYCARGRLTNEADTIYCYCISKHITL